MNLPFIMPKTFNSATHETQSFKQSTIFPEGYRE